MSWFRKPAARVAIAGLCFGVVVAGYGLFLFEGDISRFSFAGEAVVDATAAPENLTIRPGAGYDGQFFLRIALDPLSAEERVAGIRFDHPAYRQQRIGYPVVAGTLGFYDPDTVMVTMVAVNVLAYALVGWSAARRMEQLGRSPWFGLVLVLAPAFVLSQLWNLAGLLAAAFLLTGLVQIAEGKHRFAAIWLSLAVLTRETTLIVPMAGALVVGWHWFRTRRLDAGAIAYAVPLVVAGVWQLLVGWHWGALPISQGSSGNLQVPFSGLVEALTTALTGGAPRDVAAVAGALMFWLLLAMAFRSLRRSGALEVEKVGLVLAAVLLSLLIPYIWLGAQHYLRAFSEAYLLGAIVVLGDRSASPVREPDTYAEAG